MKFRLKYSDDHGEFWEEYDKDVEDPQKWSEEIIEYYNRTMYPGDIPRKLLKVVVIDENSLRDHAWEKTNVMTVMKGHTAHDTYRCVNCGITSKRFGLNNTFCLDPKFAKAKVYRRCDTTRTHLEKRRNK